MEVKGLHATSLISFRTTLALTTQNNGTSRATTE